MIKTKRELIIDFLNGEQSKLYAELKKNEYQLIYDLAGDNHKLESLTEEYVLLDDKLLDSLVNKLLKRWFVVTPKSKVEPDGDVWGMDTSLGTIVTVKAELIDDIKKVMKKWQ